MNILDKTKFNLHIVERIKKASYVCFVLCPVLLTAGIVLFLLGNGHFPIKDPSFFLLKMAVVVGLMGFPLLTISHIIEKFKSVGNIIQEDSNRFS